jgi:predicted RNA-binding Zn-ribbon protein involved in translation (DUF1610 family)
MQFSEVLRAFINQAREEIEPNEEWDREYPFKVAMLRRLVSAIDGQSDEQLFTTVLQMKTELDALDRAVYTILPSVLDMLTDELQGRRSYNTISCPKCGAAIPIQTQDYRFAARYTCPKCSNDTVLPADSDRTGVKSAIMIVILFTSKSPHPLTDELSHQGYTVHDALAISELYALADQHPLATIIMTADIDPERAKAIHTITRHCTLSWVQPQQRSFGNWINYPLELQSRTDQPR